MKEQFLIHGVELVVVGEASLLKARKRVTGCAACSRSASHSFESILSKVLGNDGITEYFLCLPTQCPVCGAPIYESTLVDCDGMLRTALDELECFDEEDEDEQDVVFIDESTLMEAQSFIAGCERCSDRAEISFDQLLDAVTSYDPTTTEYVICHAAKCTSCANDIMEKTLIVPR